MSTAMKPNLWDMWERSQAALAHESANGGHARHNTSEFPKEPSSAWNKEQSTTAIKNLRHSRRRQIRSNAEVVDWHCVQVKPDVTQVVDASSDGILFQSDREYRVGMEVFVRFPFPCASSPKQRGSVVRVEEQPDGNSRVAVQFG
jgi:hypothetical protein